MNNSSLKWVFVLLISCFSISDSEAYLAYAISTSDQNGDPQTKAYKGFRVHLTNLRVLQQKDNEFKIKYTLINTGRESVVLGSKVEVNEDLLILFDDSFQESNVSPHLNEIRAALAQKKLSIVAGQIKSDIELSFSINTKTEFQESNQEELVLIPTTPETEVVEEELNEKGGILVEENQEITITDQIKTEEADVIKPAIEKSNPEVVDIPTENISKELLNKEEEVSQQLIQEQVADDFQTTVASEQLEELANEGKDIVSENSGSTEIAANSNSEEVNLDTEVLAEEEKEEYIPYLDKDNCSDISIENLKIVKKTKRFITLEYTIVNNGTGAAQLFGTEKGEEDNVAIRANISRSTRLSRGAIVIGGDFVNPPSKGMTGELQPNESFTSTIKLETYKMTKFTPNIILELDVHNSLIECDETNNIQSISVE